MGENSIIGAVQSATDGGVAGTHPTAADASVRVGPSTAIEQNLVTAGLIPVACWRVDDVRFDFDSSFVLPEMAEEIAALAKLREAHKKRVVPRTNIKLPEFIFPVLSIFGHADPVGEDEYNKLLSGRRAAAIYGLLTRRDDIWEDLYSNKGKFTGAAAGDKWGAGSIDIMLADLGFVASADDQSNSDGKGALRAFQSSQGLPADGNPNTQTRQKLFLAYMDKLCGAEFKLDKEDDFLARGADSAGKGDYQGCSEFNPLLIFSDTLNKEFDKQKDKSVRNAANTPNRRVMVLLFRPGSKVLASKWPCPKAKEGSGGCKKRFWSDGEQRRSTRLPNDPRKFEDKQDTFSCRFYQRLTTGSPCESTPQLPFIAGRFVGIGKEHSSDVALLICDANGQILKTIEASESKGGTEGFSLHRFDPRVFPNPGILRWRIFNEEIHLVGPCDCVELRNFLARADFPEAEPLVEPEEEQPKDPGGTPMPFDPDFFAENES
jgi:hypothetical protein